MKIESREEKKKKRGFGARRVNLYCARESRLQLVPFTIVNSLREYGSITVGI